MSIVTMILGESGTGKSTSLRDLNPASTLLIQAIAKPLPFRNPNWQRFSTENRNGNIMQSDQSGEIINLMQKTRRPVIVIDDFQYIMANEFMRRTDERGFDKFTEIGRHAWDILNAAAALPDDKHVYILSHTETTDAGRTKLKTIGKLLDDKITLEGMVTIVLRTVVRDGNYYFATRNNGSDTTKTPMELFTDELIDNDLQAVNAAITQYYYPEPVSNHYQPETV